jgi:hypothetical protein
VINKITPIGMNRKPYISVNENFCKIKGKNNKTVQLISLNPILLLIINLVIIEVISMMAIK